MLYSSLYVTDSPSFQLFSFFIVILWLHLDLLYLCGQCSLHFSGLPFTSMDNLLSFY
uniref:Protein KIAA0664-like protein n=1 Tax=Rhizophora mucronata TaxID=61149 RepID=A0A2P2ME46_RHIMU